MVACNCELWPTVPKGIVGFALTAYDPIAIIDGARHSRAMDEAHCDKRLTKVTKPKLYPEKQP